jgi:hypothetical protein
MHFTVAQAHRTRRLLRLASPPAPRASACQRRAGWRSARKAPAAARRCCRGAQAHSAKSGEDLTAFEKFPEARTVDVTVVAPNKQLIGKTFKRDARAVQVRAASPIARKLLRWGRRGARESADAAGLPAG